MKDVLGKIVYESLAEIVQPKHTALLLVDVTNDFYSSEGYFAQQGQNLSILDQSLPNLTNLLDEARNAGLMVVHIQNTVLPNAGSDSPPFIRFKERHMESLPVYTIEGTWGWEFLEGFEPREGEFVVKKHRPTGFLHTDLDQILRLKQIESVVVTGCVTDGCVKSTAMDAMYRDYYTVVAPDCVGAYTQELHDAALDWMKLRMDIADSSEIASVWRELKG